MPPTKSASSKAGTSGTLVRTGPKDVEVSKKGKKGGNSGILPTTERALVLRNGKHGARGTGELFLVSKMTGREKLDLLAEDLVEKSKTAIGTPFRLKECQKLAESQLYEYLDDITNLQDPDLFASLIEEELKARTQRSNDKNAPDQTRNPSFIAATVANRIHNTYLLVSAWRIVAATLSELEDNGVTDKNIVVRLREDEDIRIRYIALFDMVTRLVDLGQDKFSVLATSTPHYLQYFRTIVTDQGEDQIYFHWDGLKNAAESFLDSIIIELCFPRAPYPRAVLYDILRDAVQEAPKEAKRFPQSLWDSVGDLAYCVELQKILEAPLLHPEAEEWRKSPYQMPIEVENWIDAQLLSLAAAEKFANFKDDIYPLSKTKNPNVLQKMWKTINSNYKAASGHDSAESLWQLESALLHPTPKWTYIRLKDSDFIDADDDGPPKLQGKKKPLLAITNGDSDTDDGMPELQDVSDSSDEEAYTDSDDESDSDDEGSESGYDTDREDEIRDMIREAMDTVAVDGDNWYKPQPDEENPFEEADKKGNSFLKLLGSLRGRMFSPSSKLKSMPASHKPDASRIPKIPKMAQTKPPPKPRTAQGVPGSLKTTIEEEEDEDNVAEKKKKKKKKKPKKKKKKTDTTDKAAAEESDAEEEPVASKPAPPAPASVAAATPSPAPKAGKQPPPKPKAPSVVPSASTISLPIGETTAQSARSYLQSEHLDAPKVKVKTRSDQPSLFEKGKGLFTKFVSTEKKEPKSTRRNWFSHLNRKAKSAMHQLLNSSEDITKGSTGMKWDTFVKLMKDMGFSVDPSTAGSSVRFDPPSGEDRAISFHKPHPDPTIDRITLKQWSKKLQKYYGWDRDDILI